MSYGGPPDFLTMGFTLSMSSKFFLTISGGLPELLKKDRTLIRLLA
jgi:hypothetical protein